MPKVNLKTRWTTREGQVISIRSLEDRHLINIVKMLRRNAAIHLSEQIAGLYSFAFHLQGEMASYYIEQDIARAEGTSPDEFLSEEVPAWEYLLREVERRGLSEELERQCRLDLVHQDGVLDELGDG
jgi:hypothetical protein